MSQRIFWSSVLLVVGPLLGRATIAGDFTADPQTTYAQARAAFVSGDLVTAGRLFDALAARFPENADYLLGLGQVRLAEKDPAAAIEALDRARALAPDYADVLRVLANANAARAEQSSAAAPSTETPDAAGSLRESAKETGRLTVAFGSAATRTEREETWHESAMLMEYAGSAGIRRIGAPPGRFSRRPLPAVWRRGFAL